MSAEIELLLSILDEAYEKQAWHGPNLRGALRGIRAEQAAWRPGAERRNIWEIAIHAAYWKYAVRRRLTGEKRGSFPLKGSNWFQKPDSITPKAWQDDLRLLAEQHKQLREVIAEMDPGRLHEKTQGSKITNVRTIYGIAAHDLYHAGQIQLLKRLLPSD
ncbi:MAG: DinB family protein [Acidobacteria bacterium]|nr:MAG: DinB family protein [Acidobacteriota bacterium]